MAEEGISFGTGAWVSEVAILGPLEGLEVV